MKRSIDELLEDIDSELGAEKEVVTTALNSEHFCENPIPSWDPQNYRDLFRSVFGEDSHYSPCRLRFGAQQTIEIPDNVHPNAQEYRFYSSVDDRILNNCNVGLNSVHYLFRFFTLETRLGKYMNAQVVVKEFIDEAFISSFCVLISDDHAGLMLSVLLYYYHSKGYNSIRLKSWKNVKIIDEEDSNDEEDEDIGELESLTALEDYFKQLAAHPSPKFIYEDTNKSYVHYFQRLGV